MENMNKTGLATDTISRAAAIDALDKCHCGGKDENGRPWIYKENAVEAIEMVEPSPPAEPQIIRCKDCAKHNKRIGDYEELPVGGKWIWKENACPLIEFRGKAQGHEFDYQFCAFGERRTE